MSKRDAFYIGREVYHRLMTHWGKGVVTAYRLKDNFGLPTPRKVQVKWEKAPFSEPNWCRLAELRKTPKEVY